MNETLAEDFAAEMDELAGSLGEGGYQPLLREFVPMIQQDVQQNFDTGATADHSPWPAHAESTVRRYGEHPLLVLSGALERAATEAGANHVEDVTDLGLTYGVRGLIYAATHQYGDPDRNIPEREYMAISEETADEMADMAGGFLSNRILGE